MQHLSRVTQPMVDACNVLAVERDHILAKLASCQCHRCDKLPHYPKKSSYWLIDVPWSPRGGPREVNAVWRYGGDLFTAWLLRCATSCACFWFVRFFISKLWNGTCDMYPTWAICPIKLLLSLYFTLPAQPRSKRTCHFCTMWPQVNRRPTWFPFLSNRGYGIRLGKCWMGRWWTWMLSWN